MTFQECVFGESFHIDMTRLAEIPGLETLLVVGVKFRNVRYGQEELLPLLEGREHARLKGCALCQALIRGEEGSPDVCPDELAYRCVVSS